MRYHHITRYERVIIFQFYSASIPKGEIARRLSRGESINQSGN